jgi:primosomal protein N' (replication factor Y)
MSPVISQTLSSSSILCEPSSTYTSTSSEQLIEVLVDIPVSSSSKSEAQKLFTYQVPAELTIEPGDILSVPFGSQQLGAIAIRFVSHLPSGVSWQQLKAVEEVICPGFFPSTYWQLLEQVATEYQTPFIQVIRTALPPGLLGRSQRRIRLCVDVIPPHGSQFLHPAAAAVLQWLQSASGSDYTWQYLQRQVKGAKQGIRDLLKRGWIESYLEPPTPPRPKLKQAVTLTVNDFPSNLTPRQREVLEILGRRGGELWLEELLKTCNTSSSLIKALEQKNCVVITQQEILRREQGILQAPDLPKALTPHQTTALNTINNLSDTAQILLHGVTGSGKTEVYLQAIAPILEQNKSALVLVPEIGLTPQLTDRFRARFGEQVCVYHSGLSQGERYDTWRNMIRGNPQIIIGTRSAIFAPLPNLGLIILDEEHDSSFKQDQPMPCYHARKVAQWRAELENCPLILGSATPSIESWQQIKLNPENYPETNNNYYYLSLPERVESRPLPPIEIVDLRQELKQGNRSIFSNRLQAALQQLQQRQQQGILFIHRRGHSTFVSCRSCGYVMECAHCDVSLSYHQIHSNAPQQLKCHYCNDYQPYPQNCPACNSKYFKHFGSGTQRVTQELTKLFPQLKVIRFDSDTTRRKDAHRILLTQFANQEADLLVGTQMLTKGLDIASVGLVAVVAADGLIHLPDYRASERAFQTLLQVAGRAGRGDDPGQVIIQTYTPEHPVIQALQRYAYEPFVNAELQSRQGMNYPPYCRLILLRLSSLNQTDVTQTAHELATMLQSENHEILGPAPAPILRIANQYRWQIILKLNRNQTVDLPQFEILRDRCPQSVRLSIDVDPLNFS